MRVNWILLAYLLLVPSTASVSAAPIGPSAAWVPVHDTRSTDQDMQDFQGGFGAVTYSRSRSKRALRAASS